jgi:transposase-like protein
MVDQRYDAVREVLDGASVKHTAIRYGVDRGTLHRWLVRYANEGLAALADKSSRPDPEAACISSIVSKAPFREELL